MKTDTIFAIIFIVLVLVLFGLITYLLYSCLDSVIFTRDRKKMFAALDNILLSHYCSNDTPYCLKEIKLLFRHHIDMNNALKRDYNNIGVLLEKYLVRLNSGEIKTLNLDEANKDLLKRYIIDLSEDFARKNPMEQINGANNILLNQLIECGEKGEKDKFSEIVNQLAIEIKTMQDSIFEKEKESKKQDVISKTGFILSIVFGMMTFIQFFI